MTAATESWAQVPELPDYEVSDQGRVRSNKRWRNIPTPRVLAQHLDGDGYPAVHLRDNGHQVTRTVHGLVALAFVGSRTEGEQVRHLDGDKANASLTNLAYGSMQENMLDRIQHGDDPWARRSACSAGHLYTDETVRWQTRADGRRFRMCRVCSAARQRAYRARLSA